MDVQRDAELSILCPDLLQKAQLPHGVIVGAIRIDGSCSVADCAGTPSEPWALGKVCNLIGAVCALPEPIAHSGALGLWSPHAAALDAMQRGLQQSPVIENDPARLPPIPVQVLCCHLLCCLHVFSDP